MTGLLDTNALIWLDQDPGKLTPAAVAFIQDPKNLLLLSVVSVWELAIKVPTGKLIIPDPVSIFVARQLANDLTLLPVNLAHALGIGQLPSVHKDPFDRLLIAQAVAEGAAIITSDRDFKHYPVQVVW